MEQCNGLGLEAWFTKFWVASSIVAGPVDLGPFASYQLLLDSVVYCIAMYSSTNTVWVIMTGSNMPMNTLQSFECA